jgi:lipopolysaccharide/colanic/teichoic acid biosynthesis glycosyltransferase
MEVLPGITGLAQVKRSYDASVDDVQTKIRYDIFYVDHRCRLLDLKILVKTIDVVVRGHGAR